MLQFLCIASLIGFAFSAQVYTPCTTPDPTISMSIVGCSAPPCSVKRGGIVHGIATFTSSVNANCVLMTMSGSIGTQQIKDLAFDACDYMSPTCPLKSKGTYTVDVQLHVDDGLPLGSGLIEAALVADVNCDGAVGTGDNKFYCINLDVVVTA